MAIKITKADVMRLADTNVLSVEKAEEIWENLANDPKKTNFTFVNVFYYLGALITISAMTWFATQAFSEFHGTGLMIVSIVYFLIFFLAGWYLMKKEKTEIPGGLLLTVAVFMVPLLIFSIQDILQVWVFNPPGDYNDFYRWIRSGWFFMEIGTIITSIIFLFKFRFTFLTFPLSFTLWYLSMDIIPLILGTDYNWDKRRIISIIFGLIMLIASYFLDRKLKKDYSFWLYLFGLMIFWGTLTSWGGDSIPGMIVYCIINLFLVFISIVFQRKVFLVFGSVGIYLFLGRLSYMYFNNSLLFPFFLSIIGVGFIALGVLYIKNKNRIDSFILDNIPPFIKAIIPKNR